MGVGGFLSRWLQAFCLSCWSVEALEQQLSGSVCKLIGSFTHSFNILLLKICRWLPSHSARIAFKFLPETLCSPEDPGPPLWLCLHRAQCSSPCSLCPKPSPACRPLHLLFPLPGMLFPCSTHGRSLFAIQFSALIGLLLTLPAK